MRPFGTFPLGGRGWRLLLGTAALFASLTPPAAAQTGGLALTRDAADLPAEIPLPPAEVRLIVETRRLPIDLPTALALAGAKNLDVLEAKARLAEAAARRDQALAKLFPEAYGAFLVFGQPTSGQTLGVFTDLGRPFDTVTAMGGVQVSLNPAHAIFTALAARRVAGAAANQSAEVTQEALADAAVGYFRLQQAQAEIQIAQQAVTASRELQRLARDRESLGAGLKVDVLKADTRVAADQIRVSQAGRALRSASVQLGRTLKLDPTLTLFPTDTIVRQRTLVEPDIPVDTLVRRALTARPAVKAQLERERAAEEERRASWSKALAPTLYADIQHNTVGQLNGGQFNVGFIGVRFSLGELGATQIAAARLDAERLQRERVEQTITTQVITARDEVATAAEQIEVALSGVRAAEGALSLSQTRFKSGVGLALDVLDSEAALIEARTNVVRAIIGYNVVQVRLLQALGAVSPEAMMK